MLNGKPVRSWQEIAEEASRETDPKKLQELAKELELAFVERDRKPVPQPTCGHATAERIG